MITRPFKTIPELRKMIDGYKLLFNREPVITISAIGPYSGNVGVLDLYTDYIYFATFMPIKHIGNKFVELYIDDSKTIVKVDIANEIAEAVDHFIARFE